MLNNITTKLCSKISAFIKDQRGVTAIEYAIIGVAISAIVLSVFNSSLGDALTGAMSSITSNIGQAGVVSGSGS
ncbi:MULTISPECIES: Flp family type IVb pilin [Vibrio]|uniref:Flp family type IVb pilin n=2 Tax=Vibrio TaxID=662 RepID=A0A7X4RX76_9VIBR|nr:MULTISPECIES: Flp family type IVb pilin [Vibrio]MBF9002236.1 Flp family type IVb pilin [Vibrio nitrifigilis]MZI96069.1 Flp family type IVb pilin [Vibrio eleionomae]